MMLAVCTSCTCVQVIAVNQDDMGVAGDIISMVGRHELSAPAC
jgi:hypothetical protein